LFAAMAFSDLAFLAIQFQTYLYTSGFLCNSMRVLFIKYNTQLVAIANWFSALSIWIMLAVTIERLAVIRHPFKANQKVVTSKFLLVLSMIVICSFAVTFVHHIAFKKVFINGRMHMQMIKHPVISAWTLIQALTVVIIPCILMAILNILLILSLKKHTFPSDMLTVQQRKDNHQILITKSKTEKKVTIMVVVILTSFTLCNMPGAIMYILVQFTNEQPTAFHKAVANCLAITGKMLNFVIFCMSSSHFRKNLLKRLNSCLLGLRRRSSMRSGGTSFSTITHCNSQHEKSPLAKQSNKNPFTRNGLGTTYSEFTLSSCDTNCATFRTMSMRLTECAQRRHKKKAPLPMKTLRTVKIELA
uniref:G_PROTEIN_RECEP_F1_2 domain-containing protein n=1 Tax=Anisakis simplex TaxID=6269 RepID=A0A0M3K614_ANISI